MLTHQFQTDTLLGLKQLAQWQEALVTAFGPFELEPSTLEPFRGFLKTQRIGGWQFNDLHYRGHRLVRTQQNVAKLEDEFYTFGLPLSGPLLVDLKGKKHQVGPGCVYLMRQSSPYQATPLSKEGYRSLSISIPALALEAKMDSLPNFYQLPLDNKSPQASLLADFISNLFSGLNLWQEQQVAQLGDQLIDLITLFMLSSQSDIGVKATSQIGAVHLERAKRYIQRHCMLPDLQVNQIAEACDISSSYLYRLFQMAEISLADYIQTQRVLYSQSLLQDKNYDHHSLADIARMSGFSQASYFSRRFKQQVGVSPSAFRTKC